MSSVPEIFGSMVFSDEVMRQRLEAEVYRQFRHTVEEGGALSREVADAIACAMKEWAVEKGATHFTHWFQPMTGVTAEKHDSFIAPGPDGHAILEFSGRELIRGEPDASSFPSGGLRATFEARGYTAWDPTSYAFVKDDSLCIPTCFCSYSGEMLDKKTPLLRSAELVSRQALRILRVFGDQKTRRVIPTVGAEQEYFLIDKSLYEQRDDLRFSGRTLFGSRPPKGQELDDHYFGAIRPRVMAFMRDLNVELWKLGIYARTEHNEVAPSQHELAPVFTDVNTATDQNQLTMEMMKRVADRHDMACLLAEKPFAGVNGSGKHNNWSLSTDSGENLLDPGREPENNLRFLLFLAAVVEAVDLHQDLLRITVASPGNDFRLGASEAPPAVVSVFLGDELTKTLTEAGAGESQHHSGACRMETGVAAVQGFLRDTSDRNRTSPFAFTGNKFEFRMVGSSLSIAGPNIILNTIVADALGRYADRLEKASDRDAEARALIGEAVRAHGRIVFNGNNYSEEWLREAERRGLVSYPTAADALPHFTDAKNITLFTANHIFTEAELRSRSEILLENYAKVLIIDAYTMIDMVKKQIFPACCAYCASLCDGLTAKKNAGIHTRDDAETLLAQRVSDLTSALGDRNDGLESVMKAARAVVGARQRAEYFRDHVLPAMQALRAVSDELETVVSREFWPFPTYSSLLFSV